MAQQHATWIEMARAHLEEHRPKTFERLQKAGKLDEHLEKAAEDASKELELLTGQGMPFQEAWEQARVHLFPAPEPGAEPAMPASEGFKAHRELMQGLGSLTMPGEKDPMN